VAEADDLDASQDAVVDAPPDTETDADTDAGTAPSDDVDQQDPEVAEEAIAAVFDGTEVEASVDDTTAALVLRGVTKSFGETRAVEGIDLTVPAGTFYGLVGPNGAGKTTTLSMIAGLIQPDRGTIRVGGIDAAADSVAAKRLMGVLPDRLRTFDRLTGRQLLHYYGVLRGLPTAVVEKRTTDLARAFDLSDALGRVVSDYSAGMAKKVMLAGAMIHAPRVLVLDEPFEAVDPVSSAIILDILSAYVAHGGTVILSSHGMELVERVCTRVAVIVAGQVLAEGTVDEVRGELTLEQRFVELAGGLSDVEGLEWLHTFSD
jgi:ABC-2 type transport system ATP-binding protein